MNIQKLSKWWLWSLLILLLTCRTSYAQGLLDAEKNNLNTVVSQEIQKAASEKPTTTSNGPPKAVHDTPSSKEEITQAKPLDILGVQLGMPRESAVQLLLSHKPPYSVTNTVALTVEDLGTSVWHISLNSPPPDYDTIDLDFAPPPTGSTVLRIYRSGLPSGTSARSPCSASP